jgi:hypothetical protein
MRRFAFFLVACGGAPITPAAPVVTRIATPAPTAIVIADADDDGVPDDCDYCPHQPGINRSDHPYGRGCPYVDQFTSTVAFAGAPIVFTTGLFYLRSLDAIARGMKENASSVTFFVIGHATPEEPDPDALALQRAEVIRAALVALGVAPSSVRAFAARPSRYFPEKSVSFDSSHDSARERVWDPVRREVVFVPLPDLCREHDLSSDDERTPFTVRFPRR